MNPIKINNTICNEPYENIFKTYDYIQYQQRGFIIFREVINQHIQINIKNHLYFLSRISTPMKKCTNSKLQFTQSTRIVNNYIFPHLIIPS